MRNSFFNPIKYFKYLIKSYLSLFLIFSFASIVATFPLILKIKTGVYGPFFTTDLRGSSWEWWWRHYSFRHQLNYNFCPFVSAPFGIDLSLQSASLFSGALSKYMAIFAGFPLGFNIITSMSFILMGVLAFFLVNFLVQDKLIAIICGLIYAFSPYHMNKTMEFCFIFHGGWLALYVLSLLKLKNQVSIKRIIFAAIAFALVLDANPYYGFFAFLFTLGFYIFCIFYDWRNKLTSILAKGNRRKLKTRIFSGWHFFSASIGVFFIGALLNFSYIYMHLKAMFIKKVDGVDGISNAYVRSFDYLISQSARPLSYLLPASTHPVFGNFTKNMFGSIFYGRGSIEQTLYLGWVPLTLAFIAFRQWRYKRLHRANYPDYELSKENFYIGFFLFSAWLAFFFSMPPTINLGLFKIYMPSFFAYKILPMFRAYARFGVVVMLCVSVLAGFGLKFFLERLKSTKIKYLFLGIVFSGIMFEFTNLPPCRVADLSKTPPVYAWLAQQPGDFIVAEYPMILAQPGEAHTNYDYLFYQTKHQKRLLDGAPIGSDGYRLKETVIDPSAPGVAEALKTLGVKYLILHEDLYRSGEYKTPKQILGDTPVLDYIPGYRLIKTFGPDKVYEITNHKQ